MSYSVSSDGSVVERHACNIKVWGSRPTNFFLFSLFTFQMTDYGDFYAQYILYNIYDISNIFLDKQDLKSFSK